MEDILITSVLGVILVGTSGGFVLCTWRGYRALKAVKQHTTTTPLTVDEVLEADTVSAFEGTVQPTDAGLLEAPLSGRPALACGYRIDREPTRQQRNVRTIEREEFATPFAVEGTQTRIRLDPADATLEFNTAEREFELEPDEQAPTAVFDRLARLGATVDQASPLRETSYTRTAYETRLEPGETVYVTGATRQAPSRPDSRFDATMGAGDSDLEYQITVGGQGYALGKALIPAIGYLGGAFVTGLFILVFLFELLR